MIAGLEGILESKNNDSLIVRAGPISLILNVSQATLKQMGNIGERIYLHTYLYVKEDNISLFGFISRGELELFQKLIMVSGVGPRLALSLLSAFEPQQLVGAIINSNIDIISQTPGIGKKIAGRLILELKSKLEKEGISEFVPSITDHYSDVIAALINLGYSLREASRAVSVLPSNKDLKLEEKIKYALQQLASR